VIYEAHGFTWDLDPDRYIDSRILDGSFESDTLRHIVDDILRPGDTFIDVGANIGWYTMFAARAVGGSGRVIAVEPEPRARARLRRHVDWYLEHHEANVTMLDVALSDAAGSTRLYVKDAYGECMSSIEYAPEGFEDAVEVETVTLDDLVRRCAIDAVRLMKVDVEGAEYAVLRGGEDAFARRLFDCVMLEFTELDGVPTRFAEIAAFLRRHGYVPEIPVAIDELVSGRISMKGLIANLFFRRSDQA
jgi:FkbM family methyltransferase